MNRHRRISKNTNEVYTDPKTEIKKIEQAFADALCNCGRTKRAMFYKCRECGNTIIIWLERGLEEHNGEYHKPVPFSIICPMCERRGIMDHVDWDNDIELQHDIEIPNNTYYFANVKNEKCGVRKFKHQIRL